MLQLIRLPDSNNSPDTQFALLQLWLASRCSLLHLVSDVLQKHRSSAAKYMAQL